MLPFTFFDQALPYANFLSQFGTPSDQDRWDRSRAAVILSPEQQKLLGSFTRELKVLVLAGAWCGDCSGQCPIFERFAEIAPVLKIRYLDRDAHPAAQQELQINGGNRVPVVVFFSEDGSEVARFGERPLAVYRNMVRGLNQNVPPIGPEGYAAEVVADWLREFERSQWIVRLSPRLRRLHQD